MALTRPSEPPTVDGQGHRVPDVGGVGSPGGSTGARGARSLRWVSYSAVAATYLLIVMGAVVRVSGSGLGCPGWPLCYGQVGPPAQGPALIEYSHRLLAGLASVLALSTVLSWGWARRLDRKALGVGAAIIGLLAAQIGLGAVTVALELPPMIVLVHLGVAMLFLGGLIAVAADGGWGMGRSKAPGLFEARPLTPSAGFRKLATGAAVGVYVLVLTGAYVRASGASWACAGFPTCNGEILPVGGNRLVDIHLLHRLVAYAVAGHLIATIARAWRTERLVPGIPRAAFLVALCLAMQIAVGAVMVSAEGQPIARVLHVAGAAALWGSTVALLAVCYRGVGPFRPEPRPAGRSLAAAGDDSLLRWGRAEGP